MDLYGCIVVIRTWLIWSVSLTFHWWLWCPSWLMWRINQQTQVGEAHLVACTVNMPYAEENPVINIDPVNKRI